MLQLRTECFRHSEQRLSPEKRPDGWQCENFTSTNFRRFFALFGILRLLDFRIRIGWLEPETRIRFFRRHNKPLFESSTSPPRCPNTQVPGWESRCHRSLVLISESSSRHVCFSLPFISAPRILPFVESACQRLTLRC